VRWWCSAVAVAAVALGAAPAQASPLAYVTNAESFNISQYSVGPGGLLAPLSPPTVGAGVGPVAVAVSPDGRSVYVTNASSDTVSQYDVGVGGGLSPKSPATVGTGRFPAEVAVSGDGKSLYVSNEGSDNVSQYDVGAGGVLSPKSPATVAAGDNPIGVAVSSAPASKDQCKKGGWKQFGFKSQGRCVAFVILTRVCDVLERHGHHLKFCPPTPPMARRP